MARKAIVYPEEEEGVPRAENPFSVAVAVAVVAGTLRSPFFQMRGRSP